MEKDTSCSNSGPSAIPFLCPAKTGGDYLDIVTKNPTKLFLKEVIFMEFEGKW